MPSALDGPAPDITRLVSLMRYITKLLGNHAGAAGIALALVEGHCSGDHWLTPPQIARMAECSVDTVRRSLKELLEGNRVTRCYRGSRRWAYRIEPALAERIISRARLSLSSTS